MAAEPLIEREWLGLRELTTYADVSDRTLRTWMRLAVPQVSK